MRDNIPQEITDAMSSSMAIGESIRLQHMFKANGQPCSVNKDARSLSLTRTIEGWLFNCHRCHYSGFISDTTRTISDVKNEVERLKRGITSVSPKVALPRDFTPMKGLPRHESTGTLHVPWDAYHWLWESDLDQFDIEHFNIGWSAAYQRVIIPCYKIGTLNPSRDEARQLIGWIGREVKYKSKQGRVAAGVVKYLTKRADNLRHLLFTAYHPSNKVVLVEDALSAIKIRKVGGATGIALLTTYIPLELVQQLKNKEVFIWLDGDMLVKSVRYTDRFRQLGLPVKFIHTLLDPKEYDQLSIRRYLKGDD